MRFHVQILRVQACKSSPGDRLAPWGGLYQSEGLYRASSECFASGVHSSCRLAPEDWLAPSASGNALPMCLPPNPGRRTFRTSLMGNAECISGATPEATCDDTRKIDQDRDTHEKSIDGNAVGVYSLQGAAAATEIDSENESIESVKRSANALQNE